MEKIVFRGKCAVFDEKGRRAIALGDLHFGFGECMRESGYLVDGQMYKIIISELEMVFKKYGRIDEIVLVGDIKHDFGKVLKEEWEMISDFFDYLKEKCNKIIIVKGNHDNMLGFIAKKKGIDVCEKYVFGDICFMHGDKKIEGADEKKIKIWVIGHGHPAVVLEEGAKKEKYKCFLEGKYKDKKVIILPSFFPFSEGCNVSKGELKAAWKFNLKSFKVFIVDEKGGEALGFGLVREMRQKEKE